MLRFAGGWFGWLEYTDPQRAELENKPRGLAKGDVFPACRLVVLRGESDRRYLGLPKKTKSFALRDIHKDYLLVELYNELCIGCLKEVGAYNRLFSLIEADPALTGNLKMIGLGVDSLNREVARFRRKHQVLFPLFADHGHEVFDCLGKPNLPVLYLLQRDPEGSFRIKMSHGGRVGSPEELLDLIRQAVID